MRISIVISLYIATPFALKANAEDIPHPSNVEPTNDNTSPGRYGIFDQLRGHLPDLERVRKLSSIKASKTLNTSKHLARQLKLLTTELESLSNSTSVIPEPTTGVDKAVTIGPVVRNDLVFLTADENPVVSNKPEGKRRRIEHHIEQRDTSDQTRPLSAPAFPELNPEERGEFMCTLYLDCTTRLEVEKADCIKMMLEEDGKRREKFSYELKQMMAESPPLGATTQIAENCFQYGFRNFPASPREFPLDFVMDVETKRRRDECLKEKLTPLQICSDNVAKPILDEVTRALDSIDNMGANRTFQMCSTTVNSLMHSCMAMRKCCAFATNCDKAALRRSINQTISDLPEVPTDFIRSEAMDCLALRAHEALPPPPVTLSPLRVRFRNHRNFTHDTGYSYDG